MGRLEGEAALLQLGGGSKVGGGELEAHLDGELAEGNIGWGRNGCLETLTSF